jgi:hypothetical protein
MGKKHALLIGLNEVNKQHYVGWTGALRYAEDGVKKVNSEIIALRGFNTPYILLRAQATRLNVQQKLNTLANDAAPGDLVVVYYAGHGQQEQDKQRFEVDKLDEAWCLYDGLFLDDELWAAWCQFRKGVRILLVSDSCNSGTIGRDGESTPMDNSLTELFSMEKKMQTYINNQAFYDQLMKNTRGARSKPMEVSLITLTACKSNQKALENKKLQHSEFSYSLLKIWNGGRFVGDHRAFYQAILKDVQLRNPNQTPQIIQYGLSDSQFLDSGPFSG